MKVKSFTRPTCKELRADVEKALQATAKKYGVNLKLGNGSFSAANFNLKIEFAVVGDGGVAKTKEHQDFVRYSFSHGIPESALGKSFVEGGETYTLTGYKPRSPRFPFLCTRDDGKVFKFPEAIIRREFGNEQKARKKATR